MAEKGFKRKLTAILSADVEGYSRLMGDDEETTVRTLTTYHEVMTTCTQPLVRLNKSKNVFESGNKI